MIDVTPDSMNSYGIVSKGSTDGRTEDIDDTRHRDGAIAWVEAVWRGCGIQKRMPFVMIGSKQKASVHSPNGQFVHPIRNKPTGICAHFFASFSQKSSYVRRDL